MSRIRPRWYQKIAEACSAINKKFATNADEPKETTIQELENRMSELPHNERFGIKRFQSIQKTNKKQHKRLR